jgi:hypothetical protein
MLRRQGSNRTACQADAHGHHLLLVLLPLYLLPLV